MPILSLFSLRKIRKTSNFLCSLATLAVLLEFSFPLPINGQLIEDSDSFIVLQPTPEGVQFLTPTALKQPQRTVKIIVTAYSSTPAQTDNDPFTTASGIKVYDGIVAANFLPFGTRVRFPQAFGDKIFVVQDRMHSRYHYRVDIWFAETVAAKNFGVQYLKMEIY